MAPPSHISISRHSSNVFSITTCSSLRPSPIVASIRFFGHCEVVWYISVSCESSRVRRERVINSTPSMSSRTLPIGLFGYTLTASTSSVTVFRDNSPSLTVFHSLFWSTSPGANHGSPNPLPVFTLQSLVVHRDSLDNTRCVVWTVEL